MKKWRKPGGGGEGEGVGKNWRSNIGGRGWKPNVWDHFARVADRSRLLMSDTDVIFGWPLTGFPNKKGKKLIEDLIFERNKRRISKHILKLKLSF